MEGWMTAPQTVHLLRLALSWGAAQRDLEPPSAPVPPRERDLLIRANAIDLPHGLACALDSCATPESTGQPGQATTVRRKKRYPSHHAAIARLNCAGFYYLVSRMATLRYR